MTFYGPQFMYLSDGLGRPREIVNGARLSENITIAAIGSRFSNPLQDGGCFALGFEPCTTNPTTLASTAWDPVDFSEEAAPWFNGTDASRDAMGFWIEEWTGLDGAHHGRSVTPVGNNRGGARFGPQSHRHRVMKINLLLHGRNAEACNYLFRWLEHALLATCSPCSTEQVWFREFDPGIGTDPDDLERGVARLTGCALVEGPTFEADPVPSSACYVRRASFTLVASDPCIYRVGQFGDNDDIGTVSVKSIDPIVAGPTYWVGQGMQVSIPSPSVDYGQGAVIVNIQSDVMVDTDGRVGLPDLRIVGYRDPFNVGFGRADQAYPIGELVVTGEATSGLEIVIDLAERSIRYREMTGFEWHNGSHLVADGTPGLRRWWSWEACAPGFVVVEPRYVGLLNTRMNLASNLAGFTVQVDTVSRFGCT